MDHSHASPGSIGPVGAHVDEIHVATAGPGFVDITARVVEMLGRWSAWEGVLTAFVRHTSASLLIQENTDPDVRRDLADVLELLAPRTRRWRHHLEGPDDMPAHVKAMVMPVSLAVPVAAGRLQLGTWQALYLVEHRDGPQERTVALSYIGTTRAGSAVSSGKNAVSPRSTR